ncbi:MAG: virulence RhuM family protein [Methanobrevibacter sp.]|nr:virulence RhuM family protein [Methanobrevibacter sp.]
MWATQKTMADLFNVSKQNISYHLSDVFKTGELEKNSTVKKILTVQTEGNRKVKRNQTFYNLDAIISVGYRVNSKNAIRFRIWVTSVLKEFMIKGFVLDDELLKNGSRFGKDYFTELVERIKEIRSSERRVYEKVTDLFATSYDYNPKAEITINFYKCVQSKLHYAISGLTPPEIIKERANSEMEHMGLTTWKDAPNGKIMLSDAKVAKNYLSEEEISELNRIVNMYLDYAENLALRQKAMSMKDWASRLDKFLEFNEYQILHGKGSISRKAVDEFVKEEFDKFKPVQDKNYISDYNRFDEQSRLILKDNN